MSDLIEKVARGIAAAQYFVDSYTPGTLAHVDALNAVEEHWPDYYSEARAAIAAVAEWIDEHHQIDKDGSVHCALTWQYTASHVAPTTPEVK